MKLEELYKQVEEKINAANANEPDKLKHIRYADLSEGEYVSKGKYDTAVAEKENLAGQIKTLNTTIGDLKKNNNVAMRLYAYRPAGEAERPADSQ